MRIDKDKRRVKIICNVGNFVIGFIHINPGERVSDFLNSTKDSFIVVTDAVVRDSLINYFKLANTGKAGKKSKDIILNKSVIKWVEEA